MTMINTPMPKLSAAPLDLVQAGKTAARQLRQRVTTDTLGGDFEHFMQRIEAGFAAAVLIAASAPPPERPFRVIDGGRS